MCVCVCARVFMCTCVCVCACVRMCVIVTGRRKVSSVCHSLARVHNYIYTNYCGTQSVASHSAGRRRSLRAPRAPNGRGRGGNDALPDKAPSAEARVSEAVVGDNTRSAGQRHQPSPPSVSASRQFPCPRLWRQVKTVPALVARKEADARWGLPRISCPYSSK